MGGRRRTHTAGLIARAEIMGALERDVLRWIICAEEVERRRYARGVLTVLIGAFEGDTLDARVIGDVFLFFEEHLAAFKLPASRRIVHIRQRQSFEFELQSHNQSLLCSPGV